MGLCDKITHLPVICHGFLKSGSQVDLGIPAGQFMEFTFSAGEQGKARKEQPHVFKKERGIWNTEDAYQKGSQENEICDRRCQGGVLLRQQAMLGDEIGDDRNPCKRPEIHRWVREEEERAAQQG